MATRRFLGMTVSSRALMVMILTALFFYLSWQKPNEVEAAITQQDSWTAAINVAANNGTYSYTAASGSSRVVVVTITSTHAAASTYTPTVTFGGTALTLARGDTSASLRNHTSIYYLPEASIPSGAQTLSVSLGVTTQRLYVGVTTFAGVDQTTPIDTSQNASRDTDGVTAVFGTALTINANDQAILVTNLYNHTDTAAISGYATPTGWSAAAISNNGTTTNAWYFFVNNYATIPTSTTTTTASWGNNLSPGTIGFSMTGVSLKMSAGCTRNAPTVSISPSSQNLGQGASVNYTLTVTNNDTAACTAATFNLSWTNTVVSGTGVSNSGESSTIGPISPGASTPTLTFTHSATGGATVGGQYQTYVAASDANHTAVTSNTVTSTVTGCTRNAPTVSISPSSQNLVQGGSVNYTLTVTNNDSGCTASTFNLTWTNNVVSGTGVSNSGESSTIGPINAGASTPTLTFTHSATGGATVGGQYQTYLVAGDANHSNVTSNTVTSTVTASGGGPASVPAGNYALYLLVASGIIIQGMRRLKKRKNDQA